MRIPGNNVVLSKTAKFPFQRNRRGSSSLLVRASSEFPGITRDFGRQPAPAWFSLGDKLLRPPKLPKARIISGQWETVTREQQLEVAFSIGQFGRIWSPMKKWILFGEGPAQIEFYTSQGWAEAGLDPMVVGENPNGILRIRMQGNAECNAKTMTHEAIHELIRRISDPRPLKLTAKLERSGHILQILLLPSDIVSLLFQHHQVQWKKSGITCYGFENWEFHFSHPKSIERVKRHFVSPYAALGPENRFIYPPSSIASNQHIANEFLVESFTAFLSTSHLTASNLEELRDVDETMFCAVSQLDALIEEGNIRSWEDIHTVLSSEIG